MAWLDLDRGTIEFKDAIEYYCKKSPSISEDIRKVMDTWLTMLTPVEGTDKVIIKLKENGYIINCKYAKTRERDL